MKTTNLKLKNIKNDEKIERCFSNNSVFCPTGNYAVIKCKEDGFSIKGVDDISNIKDKNDVICYRQSNAYCVTFSKWIMNKYDLSGKKSLNCIKKDNKTIFFPYPAKDEINLPNGLSYKDSDIPDLSDAVEDKIIQLKFKSSMKIPDINFKKKIITLHLGNKNWIEIERADEEKWNKYPTFYDNAAYFGLARSDFKTITYREETILKTKNESYIQIPDVFIKKAELKKGMDMSVKIMKNGHIIISPLIKDELTDELIDNAIDFVSPVCMTKEINEHKENGDIKEMLKMADNLIKAVNELKKENTAKDFTQSLLDIEEKNTDIEKRLDNISYKMDSIIEIIKFIMEDRYEFLKQKG